MSIEARQQGITHNGYRLNAVLAACTQPRFSNTDDAAKNEFKPLLLAGGSITWEHGTKNKRKQFKKIAKHGEF